MKYGKIVLLGDSHIEWATLCDNGIERILADPFQRRMDVVLRGYVGYTTQHLRIGWPFIKESIEPGNIEAFVVFIGSNDCAPPGETQHVPLKDALSNLDFLLPQLLDMSPRVIFVSPGLMQNTTFVRDDKIAAEYAAAMMETGKRLGAEVVDTRKLMNGNFGLLRDGLHFTNEGYGVVGSGVLDALARQGLKASDVPMHLPDFQEIVQIPESEILKKMKDQQ